MAGQTQRAIRETFLTLLDERPLHEITVKLIVERCGINRKTFYNHYRDIPDLMEQILTDEADAIMARYTQVDSFEACRTGARCCISTGRSGGMSMWRTR